MRGLRLALALAAPSWALCGALAGALGVPTLAHGCYATALVVAMCVVIFPKDWR